MKKQNQKLAKTAIEAAQSAGAVLRKYFQKKVAVREKAGAGIVTTADYAAENAALKILRKGFPDFSFLSEEAGTGGRTSSPGRWIIDPLDGTTNFFHGFPMFCVSIAAEWENEIIAGVIYHPVLDDTYLAIQGQGATLNGKRIHVSKRASLHSALLTTGFSYKKDVLGHEMSSFENISRVCRGIRRPGSAALDLAYTARGVFDAFWERSLSPWDVAAGGLLVQEAGGKVTDFKGNSFKVHDVEILAASSKLHGRILKLLS